MLIRLWRIDRCILKVSTVTLLVGATAFCRSGGSSLALESVAIEVSKPGDQVTTLGVLPNRHVYFRVLHENLTRAAF